MCIRDRYWDMYARGIMVGLTRGVNKKHICRAVLESITYQMTDLLEDVYKRQVLHIPTHQDLMIKI